MSDSPSTVSQVCSRFHRAIELIGSRWSGAIKAAIPDLTDRMLSERLRTLEGENLVVRIVVPESPVRVEYELTPKGRELQDALKEIGAWAERWIPLEDDSASKSTGTESKARKHTPSRHARKTKHV